MLPALQQGLVHARTGLIQQQHNLARDAADIGVQQGNGCLVIGLAHQCFHPRHIALSQQTHDALAAIGQIDPELEKAAEQGVKMRPFR
jgi:hypothetical protein